MKCTLVAETQTEDLFVIGRFMLTLSLGRELNHWLARYSPFVFTLFSEIVYGSVVVIVSRILFWRLVAASCLDIILACFWPGIGADVIKRVVLRRLLAWQQQPLQGVQPKLAGKVLVMQNG